LVAQAPGRSAVESAATLNYAVFGLVLVHGVLYQVLEKRMVGWVITFAVLNLLVIVLQVAGFRRRRKQKQASTTQ
jgi:uncharacterized membrane protein